MSDPKTTADAWADLQRELTKLLTPLLYWLDRQLRRSPRLYAWLSR